MSNDNLKKEITIFLVHGYSGIPKIFEYFQKELSMKNFEIVMPNFPIQTEINQERFFAIFDKYRDKLNENTIVIAHSIGNIMAMKYLCQNSLTIKGYISLAGFGEPFFKEGHDDLNNVIKPLFLSDVELSEIPQLVGQSYAIYSDNDHIVPIEILEKYPKAINAKDCFVKNIGHMGKKSGLEELPKVIGIVNEILK